MIGVVRTGCKDCGLNLYHIPINSNGYGNLHQDFDNVHITIYWDFSNKHYLVLVKGSTPKCFMVCHITAEQIKSDQVIGQFLTWVNQKEDFDDYAVG